MFVFKVPLIAFRFELFNLLFKLLLEEPDSKHNS